MKHCRNCRIEKPSSDFYRRRSGREAGQLYNVCKNCAKKRGRSYYHDNVGRQLPLAKARTRKYLNESLKFLAIVKNKPCLDCGGCFPPWVMDFDHTDNHSKTSEVAVLRRFHNLDIIKSEIAKCELVCSNCHRIRTLNRNNLNKNYKIVIAQLREDGYHLFWDKKPR